MIANRLENARSVSTTLVAALVAGCLLVATGRSASGAIGNGLRKVALTSSPAVGTDTHFAGFSSPVLNDAGRTAFEAELLWDGFEVEDYWRSRGIWSEGSGSLALLARGGDPAPGTLQAFEALSPPSINSLGQTVFRGAFSGSQSPYYTDHGIFRGGSGGVELLLRRGSPAPTPDTFIPGMQFTSLAPPVTNDTGQMAIVGIFNNLPTSGYSGLWTGDPMDLELVASQYMQLELMEGEYINGFPYPEMAINNHGQLVFVADLDGPSHPFTFYVPSIWQYDGNATTLVVRKGDAVPGSGFTFRELSSLAFNNAGQIVFSASVIDPAEGEAFRYSGLWIVNGDQIESLVHGGQPAPGMEDVRFGSTFNPVINGEGSIAFTANLEGAGVTQQNNTSVWKITSAGLEIVAREGELVPGTGIQFTDLISTELAYNRAGQLAFAQVTGYVGNLSGQMWAQDVDGNFQRIAGAGTILEVAPGDFRTIAAVSFVGGSGLEDGRRTGFNEFGHVAFEARFTDGSSGVFVSNLVAVPEPASLTLAGILAIAAVGRCRWRGRRI